MYLWAEHTAMGMISLQSWHNPTWGQRDLRCLQEAGIFFYFFDQSLTVPTMSPTRDTAVSGDGSAITTFPQISSQSSSLQHLQTFQVWWSLVLGGNQFWLWPLNPVNTWSSQLPTWTSPHQILKKQEGIKEEMICGGSATTSAGRSQLTLLFYMCLLLPLIPAGWSDLFSHSVFVSHPLAAAKVNQLLQPELAVQAAVLQGKDEKWQEGESGRLGSIHTPSRSWPEVWAVNLWHPGVTQCEEWG